MKSFAHQNKFILLHPEGNIKDVSNSIKNSKIILKLNFLKSKQLDLMKRLSFEFIISNRKEFLNKCGI